MPALTYKPFTACDQLTNVALAGTNLRRGARGPGVRLIQGGLIDLGYKLPRSTQKHGAPDGIFGPELAEVVGKFQTAQQLKADRIIGKATLGQIDVLLAKAALPPTPAAPSTPAPMVSLDYMLGTNDPAMQPDPGAGPWNSRPKEVAYIALRDAIIDVLPASIALVGDDAVAHMWHYLSGNGRTYKIDLAGMINEVTSARERYEDEVYEAQDFVEGLAVGTHQITSRTVETGYNLKAENQNWFYAIGGYKRWGTGRAKVMQDAQGTRSYELDFVYKFYDRYNWDGGKSVTLFGIKITDQFMGEFHRQGLAREFDCVGSVRRTFKWKQGDEISSTQFSSPVVTERGA